MDEHPVSKLKLSSDRDKKRAEKIADRAIREFGRAVRELDKLGNDRFAAQNCAVHMLLRVAAHAAAHNAMRDGRTPRADYWDVVCRDALAKAEKDLSSRIITLVWNVVATIDGGEWKVVATQP